MSNLNKKLGINFTELDLEDFCDADNYYINKKLEMVDSNNFIIYKIPIFNCMTNLLIETENISGGDYCLLAEYDMNNNCIKCYNTTTGALINRSDPYHNFRLNDKTTYIKITRRKASKFKCYFYKSDLKQIPDNYIKVSPDIKENYYIELNTGIRSYLTGWVATNFIKVDPGMKILVHSTLYHNNACWICAYDDDENIIDSQSNIYNNNIYSNMLFETDVAGVYNLAVLYEIPSGATMIRSGAYKYDGITIFIEEKDINRFYELNPSYKSNNIIYTELSTEIERIDQALLTSIINNSMYVNETIYSAKNENIIGNRHIEIYKDGYYFVYYNLNNLHSNTLYIYIEVNSPIENYRLKVARTSIENFSSSQNNMIPTPYEVIDDIYKYFIKIDIDEYKNAGYEIVLLRFDGRGPSKYGDLPETLGDDDKLIIKYKAVEKEYLGNFDTSFSINNTENASEIICYISPNGNDNNDGSINLPKKTINAGIISGASKFILYSGNYDYSAPINVIKSITISKKDLDGTVIFRPSNSFISDSEEQVLGYTKVYKINTNVNCNNVGQYIYQDSYADRSTLINNIERLPQQRGVKYRLQDTRIQKCSSDNLSDALNEIENETKYKFYYDINNKILYFSRPVEVSETNSIRIGCSNKLFSYETTNNNLTIKMSGIDVKYGIVNIIGTVNSELADCSSVNSFGAGCFVYDKSINIKFLRCEAASCMTNGTTGDGFNGHSSKTGDIYSKQTTCTLIDCWSHDNNDDGYSDHERSEISIHGGLYEYNGKAGITPSYGSHCTCYNVYSRYNYAGFYYIGSSSDGGEYGQLLCINCIADNNSNGGSMTGFKIDGTNNRMELINCISMNNPTGYACDSSNIVRLVDCKSYNDITIKNFAAPAANISIINTNNIIS